MNRFTYFDFRTVQRLIQSVDPVAIGFGRIAINVNEFLVISFVGSGSLRAVASLLNYRGRSEQSYYLQIKSNFLRVRCKLVATFNNPVGSPIGFAIGSSNGKRTVISKHHRLHLG